MGQHTWDENNKCNWNNGPFFGSAEVIATAGDSYYTKYSSIMGDGFGPLTFLPDGTYELKLNTFFGGKEVMRRVEGTPAAPPATTGGTNLVAENSNENVVEEIDEEGLKKNSLGGM